MYRESDELLLHQTAEPFETVSIQNRNFFDRMYFNIHNSREGFYLITGLGSYPNTSVVDAYLCCVYDNRQYNLRLSMETQNRQTLEIGPLKYSIVKPLEKWFIHVDPCSDIPFSADIEFNAVSVPYEANKYIREKDNIQMANHYHMVQPGQWMGKIKLNNNSFSVDGWMGARDRSWGFRSADMGVQLHVWITARFDNLSLFLSVQEDANMNIVYQDGAVFQGNEVHKIKNITHSLIFEKGSREHLSGCFHFEDERGNKYQLKSKKILPGINNVGGWFGGGHGKRRGTYHAEGDVYELATPPGTFNKGVWARDQLCTFELNGLKGEGIFEHALSKRHKGYGEQIRD